MPTIRTYTEVLARNIRSARAAAGLQQEPVAVRMRKLGFTAWLRQTVANVEKGRRGLRAEEIIGLALALETTVPQLLEPLAQDEWVQLPSGESLAPGAYIDLIRGRIPSDISWYNDNFAKSGRSAAALAFEATWPDEAKPPKDGTE
ncbi:MAG: helix-turn-helix domain-containing protein [Streptosporangiaceae bacterium]